VFGKFKLGSTPWNKGKKGLRLSPDTEYKADGTNTGELHPSWKGGVQTPKNDCAYLWESTGKRKRRPRLIFEEFYGQIPEGHVIVHIDGDKNNDDPLNLMSLSRADNLKRNIEIMEDKLNFKNEIL